MIKSVIIDDEANNISSLENLLKTFCPEISIVGTAKMQKRVTILLKK